MSSLEFSLGSPVFHANNNPHINTQDTHRASPLSAGGTAIVQTPSNAGETDNKIHVFIGLFLKKDVSNPEFSIKLWEMHPTYLKSQDLNNIQQMTHRIGYFVISQGSSSGDQKSKEATLYVPPHIYEELDVNSTPRSNLRQLDSEKGRRDVNTLNGANQERHEGILRANIRYNHPDIQNPDTIDSDLFKNCKVETLSEDDEEAANGSFEARKYERLMDDIDEIRKKQLHAQLNVKEQISTGAAQGPQPAGCCTILSCSGI